MSPVFLQLFLVRDLFEIFFASCPPYRNLNERINLSINFLCERPTGAQLTRAYLRKTICSKAGLELFEARIHVGDVTAKILYDTYDQETGNKTGNGQDQLKCAAHSLQCADSCKYLVSDGGDEGSRNETLAAIYKETVILQRRPAELTCVSVGQPQPDFF